MLSAVAASMLPTKPPRAKPIRSFLHEANGFSGALVIVMTPPKKAIKEQGKPAYEAIVAELLQMLRTKRALRPVMKASLSRRQMKRVIRSFMFLKTKFNAEGKFDKIKARMVANGKQQDRKLYPDTYSPTVMLQSVFMCLAIASLEGRRVASVDIGGAYLNAAR